ncbi:hypothetical protein BJV82DRAFT_662202 [Fennellomyces sp. T-0311]|nr:hypothetical protein BJV82DRAFT_662202 [Fennellomyces sp. T-0311]
MDFMSAGSYTNSNLMRPRSHVNSITGISELQDYEQKLSDIATATLEQGFRGDLNHVDHWFGLLSDTEQMAVLYTLLQHCSQNNARFFITVLQQMADRRPRSRTSDLDRPYPITRSSAALNNRHSIAFGDSPPSIFSPLFGSIDQQRPRSVIDNNSTFLTPAWNQITPKSVIGDRRTITRPKSADVSTWWDPTKQPTNIPGTVPEADEQEKKPSSSDRESTISTSSGGGQSEPPQVPSASVSSSRKVPKTAKEKRPTDTVDMELLNDIPAWFRSLRLHKYTNHFESMKWQDILKMSDEQLEKKGVAALGARRKMLKVFENVRAHCGANHIPY